MAEAESTEDTKAAKATDKPKIPKGGGDGYDRVDVTEAANAGGEPAAWGHNGLDEGVEGSDTPAST
jgi:hypothetical protein